MWLCFHPPWRRPQHAPLLCDPGAAPKVLSRALRRRLADETLTDQPGLLAPERRTFVEESVRPHTLPELGARFERYLNGVASGKNRDPLRVVLE